MAIAPHQYAILANKTNKPFDNRNPRSYVQEIENNQAVDKAVGLIYTFKKYSH
jgi:hypothetical protein